MIADVQFTKSWSGAERATFPIGLGGGETAYLCVYSTLSDADNRFVVLVEAERLLSLWRNDPHRRQIEISSGGPDTWMRDPKYHLATRGFEHGPDNPVPLARVICSVGRERRLVEEKRFLLFRRQVEVVGSERPYVLFIDGITRTIWLLTRGARQFPVECNHADAELLAQLAAVAGTRPLSVEKLMSRSHS